MLGHMNVYHNPASLGYLTVAKKIDILDNGEVEFIDSLDSEFSESFEQVEEADSNVVSEDAEFDDFEENESEEEIVFIEENILSDSVKLDTAKSSSNFSMSIFNFSFGLGSGSITPDWINNQLFGGRDLRNIEERKDFLSGISEDMNIQVPLVSALPVLNISFGSTVIGLGQIRSYTSIKIPSGLVQVPFKGIDKDEELNINAQTVIDQLTEDQYLGEVVKSETIFPQIGEELRDQGGIAILVAMLVILVYIIFRFQIKFGYGAIAALFHDVLIILGIFSIFNLTFDLSVLAALLAVVGYSLNDSIVVSDRIRENFLDENKKGSSEVLLNDSLNQVFARTIITSFTTLLVLIALLIAGGEALKNFSLALAAGVIVGSYSSIFIVVRVLLLTGLSKKDMEKPKNEPEESYSLD